MPIPSNIDQNNVPKHIAIIMDGNGRWAKGKGMQRVSGHKNALSGNICSINCLNWIILGYF